MASDRVITKKGFQLIIRSGTISRMVREAVTEGLTEAGENYKRQVIKNISKSDHTLGDLRKLGHPYSATKPEGTLHGDDRIVHEQSGELIRSLVFHPVEETTSRRFSIYISSSDPVMPYLIYGTSFMRPRNFPQKAYEEIKASLWNPVINALQGIRYHIESK